MREKLLNLMKTEQLTASKLAELLGIQPSGISHILGGRNKPSFDLVQKILRRFPQINPDWLLLDRGEMYRAISVDTASPLQESPTNSAEMSENLGAQENAPVPDTTNSMAPISSNANFAQETITAMSTKHGRVKRVIILFEDHTFESYEMQK